MHKISPYLLIAYCLLLIAPKTAYANFGLAIDPPIFQVDATAPTAIKVPLTIENTGSDVVNLSIKLKPFKSSALQNGTIDFLDASEPMPGNDPFILQKVEVLDNDNPIKNIILGPTQEKKLTLHIVIPKDEPSGDYYFSIVFSSSPESLTESNNIQSDLSNSKITGSIGTNVLLSIGPKTKTTGSIVDFSTPFLIFQGPVEAKLLVENSSKHFIVPKGAMVIKNTFGQNIADLKLLPVNVLSESERYMITDSSFSDGTIIWPEKILFGLYTMHLRITLSDDGPLFDRTIYFFALPVPVILGIVLASIIIAMIGLRVRERLKK